MIKYNKIIAGFIIALLVFTISLCVVFAASAKEQRIFDYANILSLKDTVSIESQITKFRQEHNMDLVVLTIDDAKGKSPIEYADDFYDENGFGIGDEHSGALLLIDMDNREPAISTTGDMIDYLSDERIESMFDNIYDGLYDGNYGAAASAFISESNKYVDAGYPKNAHRYDTETGEITRPVENKKKGVTLLEGIIATGASLLSGGIGIGSVRRKYALNAGSIDKFAYQPHSNFTMGGANDNLLNDRTTQRVIPIITGGGGGGSSGGSSAGRSSTHTSSSGRSHGGGSGGRKF